jgi:hypothetical protein
MPRTTTSKYRRVIRRGERYYNPPVLKVRYPLERGGEPRLEVAWADGYRALKVRLDEEVVARSDVASLRRGRTFKLPDGRPLAIAMPRGVAMWIDGKPVPGTYADPWIRVQSAPIWVLSIGILAVWRALYLAPERPWPYGTWANLAFTVSLIACAVAMRRGSYWAHVLATVVTLIWLFQAFPTLSVHNVSFAEQVVRVLGAVAYVAIGTWVLRKIGQGAEAAREIQEENHAGTTPENRGRPSTI